MIKRATMVWLLLAGLAGTGLFLLKYEVQGAEERLAATNHDILDNLEAIHVLEAEWAYLNQPARLEDLGRRLLEMEPMTADQVATIDQIPFRPGFGPQASPPEAAPKPDAPPKIARRPDPAAKVMPLLAKYERAK